MLDVHVDIEKIKKNLHYISNLCLQNQCALFFCIKGLAGNMSAISSLLEEHVEGIHAIADSKESHFAIGCSMFDDVKKILISMPSYYNQERAQNIVENTDICYVSDLHHLQLLEKCCKKLQKFYSVILMFDSGDGREGIPINDNSVLDRVCIFLKRKGVHLQLQGISTHIGCITNTIPKKTTLIRFAGIADMLKRTHGFQLQYIIAGGSNALPLLQNRDMPKAINVLCVGEAIILGNIPGYQQHALKLETGNIFIFADICEIRAINDSTYKIVLFVGKNDFHKDEIIWGNLKFIGYSADYTVAQIPKALFKIAKSGKIKLYLKYYAASRLLSSPYVKVCLIS